MKIKGLSYDFIIYDDSFDIIPKGKYMKDFDTLCFIEDLDVLFIAVQKAIENREKLKEEKQDE